MHFLLRENLRAEREKAIGRERAREPGDGDDYGDTFQ